MTQTEETSDRAARVRAAQHGDTDAFAELVNEESRTLLLAARAILHDHHEAEDVAHDTLLTAWQEIGKLRVR